MAEIIRSPRSISLNADMEPERYEPMLRDLEGAAGLESVKLGFGIALSEIGLPRAVEIAHDRGFKAIYDHQKAATDTPHTGSIFADRLKRAGVDGAIIFPFTGPDVEISWIKALQDQHILVLCGAKMSHPRQLADSTGLRNGFIHPEAPARIYTIAAQHDVRDFVLPGNDPEAISRYRRLLANMLGEGTFRLWSPGIGEQGGDIITAAQAAGPAFHAFIGRSIFNAAQPRQAAETFSRQLLSVSAS